MKALCYISNFDDNLKKYDIDDLIQFVNLKNKQEGITGVLLIRNKYFFQILEGEEAQIDRLYSKIKKDTRHQGLLKILDKKIEGRIFSAYNSGQFKIIDRYSDAKKLVTYFNWIKNADYLEADELISLTNNFLKYNS